VWTHVKKTIIRRGGKSTTTESRPMTKAEEKRFDRAFARMDRAFEEMDKAFKLMEEEDD
jgi:cellobiose-specific phosphotransferase system component IIA